MTEKSKRRHHETRSDVAISWLWGHLLLLREITSMDKSPSRNDEKDRHCVLVPSIVITEEETCLRRGDLRFANCNSCLLLHEIASTFCLAMTSVLRRITSTDKSPSRNDEKDRHCVLVPSIVITRREATWWSHGYKNTYCGGGLRRRTKVRLVMTKIGFLCYIMWHKTHIHQKI